MLEVAVRISEDVYMFFIFSFMIEWMIMISQITDISNVSSSDPVCVVAVFSYPVSSLMGEAVCIHIEAKCGLRPGSRTELCCEFGAAFRSASSSLTVEENQYLPFR